MVEPPRPHASGNHQVEVVVVVAGDGEIPHPAVIDNRD
jgi:hypothetical protein